MTSFPNQELPAHSTCRIAVQKVQDPAPMPSWAVGGWEGGGIPGKIGETCRTVFWWKTGAAFIESKGLPYCVPDLPAFSGAQP